MPPEYYFGLEKCLSLLEGWNSSLWSKNACIGRQKV